MGKILENLHRTLAAGLVLAIIVLLWRHSDQIGDRGFWAGIFRWIHVFTGVLWIGLLYYFNFVQIPTMPKIPDELKPAVGKHIAPAALFFFRWAAAATVLFGILTAGAADYISALWFQQYPTIGVGMWLALIMAANVWGIIWPNQKKALGIVEATPDEKKAAARLAMLASRTNTMLSIPMLYCMVMNKLG
jgi:uncharacterized membrane protein